MVPIKRFTSLVLRIHENGFAIIGYAFAENLINKIHMNEVFNVFALVGSDNLVTVISSRLKVTRKPHWYLHEIAKRPLNP